MAGAWLRSRYDPVNDLTMRTQERVWIRLAILSESVMSQGSSFCQYQISTKREARASKIVAMISDYQIKRLTNLIWKLVVTFSFVLQVKLTGHYHIPFWQSRKVVILCQWFSDVYRCESIFLSVAEMVLDRVLGFYSLHKNPTWHWLYFRSGISSDLWPAVISVTECYLFAFRCLGYYIRRYFICIEFDWWRTDVAWNGNLYWLFTCRKHGKENLPVQGTYIAESITTKNTERYWIPFRESHCKISVI